jgi:hypothetical protein
MIVGDATITHPPLCHDRVKAGIRDGTTAAAALATDERVDLGIAVMLLFDLSVSLSAHVEEHAADGTCNRENANDDTAGYGSDIGAAARFCWRCRDHNGGCYHGFDCWCCTAAAASSLIDALFTSRINDNGKSGIVDCPCANTATCESCQYSVQCFAPSKPTSLEIKSSAADVALLVIRQCNLWGIFVAAEALISSGGTSNLKPVLEADFLHA